MDQSSFSGKYLLEFGIPEKLVTLSYVKKCREISYRSDNKKESVGIVQYQHFSFNTGTLWFTQPPDATFSIFQECQSSESEVLVWVSPNHSSSTRDLEKPILALPVHWIGTFQVSSVL